MTNKDGISVEGFVIVIPYRSAYAANHIAQGNVEGDVTLCGRDCYGWSIARDVDASDLSSAFTCKRCAKKAHSSTATNNKDGISVEETRALLEGVEGVHPALSTAELREAAEPLARAYLALSEREAAKDAEIAREGFDLAVVVVRSWIGKGLSASTNGRLEAVAQDLEASRDAALTKGQADAG